MNGAHERRMRRVLVLCLYLLAATSGLCQARPPTEPWFYPLFAVAFASAITAWCAVDSRILGRPMLHSFYWLVFLTWPVGVPFYLIWSRGLPGLGLAVVHAFALYGTSAAAFIAAAYG